MNSIQNNNSFLSKSSKENDETSGPDKSDEYFLSETDWDSLYEVEEEETELDMKNNGSVITHLLSQAITTRKKTMRLSQILTMFFQTKGPHWHGSDKDSATHLYSGEAFPAGDVCRLLCAS